MGVIEFLFALAQDMFLAAIPAAVFKRLPELDRTVRQLEKDVKNLKNE